jgi:putative ABC transport system permease protein
MSRGFYRKLAWTGIKKNKQLYYPYLIAGIAMVMVFYIFSFLAASSVVRSLPGREVLPILFDYGSWTIGVFSIPFLFYTNSSLIKKRKKEFGLYNILGMNKKNIFSVLFWETLISYGIVVIGGIFSGVIFSKIAELGLVNIMDKEVNYRIYVEWKSVLTAVLVFAAIYFLILLNTLRQIHNNNPIELLHSDFVGERPPKSRWFPAVISLILILTAYYIVAKLEPPMQIPRVFAAAGLITIGTFLLFLCASIFLCKLLQKNKKYYYKTSHFVTVSTMSYRMKRNGASLAAICVLVTLILVTLSFSVSFYEGSTSSVENHYPYDIGVSVEIPTEKMEDEMSSGAYTQGIHSEIESIAQEAKDVKTIETYSANMLALITDGRLDLSADMRNTWFVPGYYDGWERGNDKIVYIHVISLDEYNKLCKTSEKLDDNEVLVASETVSYQSNDIVLYNGKEVRVSKTVKQIPKMTEVRLDGASLDSHGCE